MDQVSQALQRIAATPELPDLVEKAMMEGDIAKMPADMKVAYYNAVCYSVGLNPLTRPLDAIRGQDGTTKFYFKKEAAEQLRKLHKVSVRMLGRLVEDDLYIVTVEARTPDGRC